MNKMKNEMTNLVDTMVVVKFTNGRAMSGILREDPNGSFSIKLGIQVLPLDLSTIQKVTVLD